MSEAASIAWKSIVVAILVLGLKTVAAWLSGSVALYSDAVESIVNIVTATAAFAAILYSSRPADEGHPYGHEKAEYFVALLEAVLIGAAAFAILQAALFALFEPKLLHVPPLAIAANIGAGIINGAWCYWLIRKGRELKSAALVSDGWHLYADVVSSIGVLVGILLALATGAYWIDPVLGILVALNILWSGWQLLKVSMGGLMDMAPDEETRNLIADSIKASGDGAMEAHDLRARESGPVTFIEFHLVMSGEITVKESHVICDRIEASIREKLPQARITIHVEPEEKAKDEGAIPLKVQ